MIASVQPAARRVRIHWLRRRVPTHLKLSHSASSSGQALLARAAQTTFRPAARAPRATRRGKTPSPALRPGGGGGGGGGGGRLPGGWDGGGGVGGGEGKVDRGREKGRGL